MKASLPKDDPLDAAIRIAVDAVEQRVTDVAHRLDTDYFRHRALCAGPGDPALFVRSSKPFIAAHTWQISHSKQRLSKLVIEAATGKVLPSRNIEGRAP